ncbi:conserved hypothetical protein [Echinococcus multilocularis]|uniref:Uncharacterized protein n=1 Tax=Echinococcus multilocularis TaxID=6211 RepID=A0A068YNN6_ECHMU|nr:conserved hypothetical protein [Echinococcus multilocularis]
MQNFRHFSNVQHSPFDPVIDGGLYIDLENLPTNTPTVTLDDNFAVEPTGTIQIPVFIVGPMVALSWRCGRPFLGDKTNFIDSLDFSLVYDPTPENPNCKVCQLVRWLLTECPSYATAVNTMYSEDPIIVFEVMREIWSRFTTKVLRFSKRHLQYARSISYLSLPLDPNYISPLGLDQPAENMEWPDRMVASLEWTNGFMFLLRGDIGERGIYSHVACFIFIHLINFLRAHVVPLIHPLYNDSLPQFLMLHAIRDRPTEVNQAIAKLTRAVFLVLTEFDPDWLLQEYTITTPQRKEECFWYRHFLGLMVENIFAMNVCQAFFAGVQNERLYVHFENCTAEPERCLCRFARFLETTA